MSLVDQVYEAIQRRILSGAYPPGSRLHLTKLAQEHGVSFIPVREAMRRLEAERLVEIVNNRGARVASISVFDMQDIYRTRVTLECDAIRRAFPHLTPELLDIVDKALERMTELFHLDDAPAAYRAHRDVHFSLYRASGSKWLLHLIAILWDNAERYLYQSAQLRQSPEDFAAEHVAILQRLRERDIDGAVQALAANLTRTAELLSQAYGPRVEDLEPTALDEVARR